MKLKEKMIFIVGISLLILSSAVLYDFRIQSRPPVLQNIIVSEGDLVYDKPEYVSEYGPLMPFGATVYNQYNEDPRLSPTYEYYLKEDARIVSPLGGIVSDVVYQPDTQDYYVWIKPSKNSDWIVEIDHLRNLTVDKGSRVFAGTILGYPGSWYPQQGVGRTELMIVKEGRPQRYYCPYYLLNSSLKTEYRDMIGRVFEKSKKAMDLKIQVLPACIYKVLEDGPGNDYEHLIVSE